MATDAPEPDEGRQPLLIAEARRRLAESLARRLACEATEDGLIWRDERDDHPDGEEQR